MPDRSVESLRQQLRARGYLSSGLERWFSLDPWSSRTFWLELSIVSAKAATLGALFAAIFHVAVMLLRNHPLGFGETLQLFALYGAGWWLCGFTAVVLFALVLKLRPALPIETPRALLAISIAVSGAMSLLIGIWWYGFAAQPSALELGVGGALAALFFLIVTIVVSAALLSFSIYEVGRIPSIHQKSRSGPIAAAAGILVILMFMPALQRSEPDLSAPEQVVTSPTQRRVALVGVDGMTYEILQSRPDLAAQFAVVQPARTIAAPSTAERWASIGTGVPPSLHGVRAVAGVRLTGGAHLIQQVSAADFLLARIAPALGIAAAQPLPPTVRRRDYIWEIFASRGTTAAAVNWWTSETTGRGALESVGQESIFSGAAGDALKVDRTATARLLDALARNPQFATVYLPALDVVLNRTSSDASTRLSVSIRALDNTITTIEALKNRGYAVVLAGMPGEMQEGRAVIASTLPLRQGASELDVAPTVCELMGFPASLEMPGRSLAGAATQARITTYGNRTAGQESVRLTDEYYQSLRSLGYIR